MKNIAAALAVATTLHAHAQTPPPPPLPPPVAAAFTTYGEGLPLAEFVRVTVGELAGRAYVIAPDIAPAEHYVIAKIKGVRGERAMRVAKSTLESVGLTLRESDDVVYVEKARTTVNDERRTLVYTPQHRSVGALAQYLGVYSDKIELAYARGIATQTGTGKTTGAATYSQADKSPAVLLARGTPRDIAELEQLLEQLDTPTAEVTIRAHVLEVRTTREEGSGVGLVLDILGGRISASAGANTSRGDTLKIGTPWAAISLHSLTADSRIKLLSSPVLRVTDNATATARVGAETPTLGEIVTTQTATQQSVVYQDSGVILELTPEIHERTTRLQVRQELSNFVITDTGLSNTPTKLRRAFSSTVSLRDGETLILGGLIEQTTSENKTGAWLATTAASETRSEIVVLLSLERTR